jgi:hypothetical protein
VTFEDVPHSCKAAIDSAGAFNASCENFANQSFGCFVKDSSGSIVASIVFDDVLGADGGALELSIVFDPDAGIAKGNFKVKTGTKIAASKTLDSSDLRNGALFKIQMDRNSEFNKSKKQLLSEAGPGGPGPGGHGPGPGSGPGPGGGAPEQVFIQELSINGQPYWLVADNRIDQCLDANKQLSFKLSNGTQSRSIRYDSLANLREDMAYVFNPANGILSQDLVTAIKNTGDAHRGGFHSYCEEISSNNNLNPINNSCVFAAMPEPKGNTFFDPMNTRLSDLTPYSGKSTGTRTQPDHMNPGQQKYHVTGKVNGQERELWLFCEDKFAGVSNPGSGPGAPAGSPNSGPSYNKTKPLIMHPVFVNSPSDTIDKDTAIAQSQGNFLKDSGCGKNNAEIQAEKERERQGFAAEALGRLMEMSKYLTSSTKGDFCGRAMSNEMIAQMKQQGEAMLQSQNQHGSPMPPEFLEAAGSDGNPNNFSEADARFLAGRFMPPEHAILCSGGNLLSELATLSANSCVRRDIRVDHKCDNKGICVPTLIKQDIPVPANVHDVMKVKPVPEPNFAASSGFVEEHRFQGDRPGEFNTCKIGHGVDFTGRVTEFGPGGKIQSFKAQACFSDFNNCDNHKGFNESNQRNSSSQSSTSCMDFTANRI